MAPSMLSTQINSLDPDEMLHPLDDRPSRDDLPALFLIGAMVLCCAAVVAPYRDIIVPRTLLFASGVSIFLLLLPLVMRQHQLIVLLLVTYMPFSKSLPGTFGGLARTFNMTNILLGLSVAGWLINSALHHRPLFKRSRLDAPLFAFMALATLSLLRGFLVLEGRNPVETIFALKRWLTPMFLFFVIYNTLRTLRLTFGVYLSLCMTSGVIGMIGVKKFYMDLGSRSSIEKMRLGVVSGSNHLGFMMCCCVFLLIAVFYAYRKDRRAWLLLIPVFSCLQTLRLTFSRGAQVGFAAGFILWAFFVNKRLFIALCLFAALVAYDPSYFPQRLSGRLAGTVAEGDEPVTQRLDKSSKSRLEVWRAGMQIAMDHPILGTGYGTFHRYIGRYAPEQAGRDAHNTYLIIVSEMGFPALIFFLWFLFGGLRAAWRVYQRSTNEPLIRMMTLGYIGFWGAATVGNLFGTRFDSAETAVQLFFLTAIILTFEDMLDPDTDREDKDQASDPETEILSEDTEPETELLPPTFSTPHEPLPPGTQLNEWNQRMKDKASEWSWRG